MQTFSITSDQRKALIEAAYDYLRRWPNEKTNPALKNALTKLVRKRNEARKGILFQLFGAVAEEDTPTDLQTIATLTETVSQLQRERDEAEQQLEVLRPGGRYAWKSKFEASEAECVRLRKERDEAVNDLNWRLGMVTRFVQEPPKIELQPHPGGPWVLFDDVKDALL